MRIQYLIWSKTPRNQWVTQEQHCAKLTGATNDSEQAVNLRPETKTNEEYAEILQVSDGYEFISLEFL